MEAVLCDRRDAVERLEYAAATVSKWTRRTTSFEQKNANNLPCVASTYYLRSSDSLRNPFGNGSDIRDRFIRARRQAETTVPSSKYDAESEEEILTPFEALAGFRQEAPAYWISCSYSYHPKSTTVETTIRQTGVLPDLDGIRDIAKLTLQITMFYGKSKKMKTEVILKRSGKDTSFKSNHVRFTGINEKDLKASRIRFRIFCCKWITKRQVAEWVMSTSDCQERIRTQWNRVAFF